METVFFPKLPVGFDAVSADAENLDIAGCEFFDVLLKLNKFRRSVFGVVFGIKGDQGAPVPVQYRAQGHHLAALVRQGERRGQIDGWLGHALGLVSGTTRQYKYNEHQGNIWPAIH